MKLLMAIISVLLISCADKQCDMCPQYDWGFDYNINVTANTTSGIEVDSSGQYVDLSIIDQFTEEAEECLFSEFPDGNLTEDVMSQAYCMSSKKIKPIDYSCIAVKIPSDWAWSCDGAMQLLSDSAPQESCDDKGFGYSSNCPCKWRAGVQGNNTIIVTPNLYLYKDPLVKIITGCWNPWGSTKLSKCMGNVE